jgi:hypothetical protein
MSKANNLLSFTVASLRLNETIKIAQFEIEHGLNNYKEIKDADVVFGGIKSLSFEKTFYQIRKRIETLTHDQKNILIYGDYMSQKQIAFLAFCKCYQLVKDFTIEVVREKILMFNYQINESDFRLFILSKQQQFPKLENYSENTLNKARQVMFLVLEQAGIINNVRDKIIQPQLIHTSVIKSVFDDDRSLLKIFLLSDSDIKNYS